MFAQRQALAIDKTIGSSWIDMLGAEDARADDADRPSNTMYGENFKRIINTRAPVEVQTGTVTDDASNGTDAHCATDGNISTKKTEYEFPKTRKCFFVFENLYFASPIRNGLIMRMRMLVKTPYYAHHFIKIGLLCLSFMREYMGHAKLRPFCY